LLELRDQRSNRKMFVRSLQREPHELAVDRDERCMPR